MCGIAGVISLGSALGSDDRECAEKMLSALRRRGPDGAALFADERAILGNTRLRVTDLSSAADLPMGSDDGGVWLAYNGAVTNFRELRRRLEAGRRPFRSSSDTEVVLRLYEERGIAMLGELTGMFAFCLLDRARRKAYLVRDFYGQRPLFYHQKNGRLHFASEIKAFLELPGFDKSLDVEGLYHFFSLAYVPGARTPFASVRELGGGRLLEIDLDSGRLSEREFYRLNYEADESLTEDEAVRRVRELMLDSVRRNFDVDVPVGLALSGGVDSGGLLALLKELGLASKVHTFSIRMDSPSFDESAYQRQLVEFARPIHHEVTVKASDAAENLLRHMAYLDEPSGDGAAIPFFLLAEEAGKHVRVMLSGEGGDEVFNAYETHRAYRARQAYRRWVPEPARRLVRAAVRRLPVSHDKLSLDFLAKRFAEGAELGVPEAHCYWRHALPPQAQARLLAPSGAHPPTESLFREMFDALPFPEELDRISSIDIAYYFIGDLMVKNDRMFMAHSVEGRYPYMDRPLVEQAARLPLRYKLRGLRGRIVQKRALEGLLSPAVRRRSNMGLEMPHSGWFPRELRGLAARYFEPRRAARSGLLDPSVVQQLWREHLERRADHGRALWCALNFLVWFDLFVYDGDYKSHWDPTRAAAPARWLSAPGAVTWAR